jgi:hypothetical protein
MEYISNGIYSFNREDKVEIMEDINKVQDVLVPLMDFFYHVQVIFLPINHN